MAHKNVLYVSIGVHVIMWLLHVLRQYTMGKFFVLSGVYRRERGIEERAMLEPQTLGVVFY